MGAWCYCWGVAGKASKMIEMATRRNREHVEAGRAVVQAVALEDVDLGDRRFDKVFAWVNESGPEWRLG